MEVTATTAVPRPAFMTTMPTTKHACIYQPMAEGRKDREASSLSLTAGGPSDSLSAPTPLDREIGRRGSKR